MNPNLANEAHKGAAARSPLGKLKVSLNAVRDGGQVNPASMAARAVGFDGSDASLQAYHNFVAFVKGHPIKTLSEIDRLEGMIGLMEANFNKIVEKVEQGKDLSDKDRKNMFLVKDTLVEIHKLKYGEKRININADLKDIRDSMFDDK